MGVCLVACSCGQYTGLCVFGALRKVASVLAFAGLRIKLYLVVHNIQITINRVQQLRTHVTVFVLYSHPVLQF